MSAPAFCSDMARRTPGAGSATARSGRGRHLVDQVGYMVTPLVGDARRTTAICRLVAAIELSDGAHGRLGVVRSSGNREVAAVMGNIERGLEAELVRLRAQRVGARSLPRYANAVLHGRPAPRQGWSDRWAHTVRGTSWQGLARPRQRVQRRARHRRVRLVPASRAAAAVTSLNVEPGGMV